MRLLIALTILVSFALPGGNPVLAQTTGGGSSVMQVRGIAVDATAESAVVAREAALADGQARALTTVFQRITLREDWPRLPNIDAATLATLVRTLEINDEKTSAVRYLASLTVGFDTAAIKSRLRSVGIPYSVTRSDPVLLLPVMEKGGALLLFDDGNDWRDAWDRSQLDEDGLLPIRLPLGDLQDLAALAPAAAVSGGAGRLAAIAERYEVKTVVVAHAVPSLGFAGTLASNVTVNLSWNDSAGTQTVALNIPSRDGDAPGDALDRAVREVAIELGQIWKRNTLVEFGSEVALSVFAPLDGLNDWIDMRRRLSRISMVQSVTLDAISRRNAQLTLRVLGSPSRLALPLARQGLELREIDGYWQLGWRQRAGRQPASSSPAAGGSEPGGTTVE